MMSSITVESSVPCGSCGTTRSCIDARSGACTAMKTGISNRLPPHSTTANRSKRRKLPVAAAASIRAAATATPAAFGTPKYSSPRLAPMNSVTIVSAFSTNKSMTLNAPQNAPKRARISRACPTPATAPSRSTISWLTYSTGTSSSSVQSRLVP